MSGSKFVEGILSCGVEVELSKAAMDATQNFANQMLLVGTFLDSFNDLSLKASTFVQNAEDAMADAETANANGQLAAGVLEISGPGTTIGYRTYREGTFGRFSPSELKELNQGNENLEAWKKNLNGGDAEIISGNRKANPLAASEEEQLQNAPLSGKGKPQEIEMADLSKKNGSPSQEKDGDSVSGAQNKSGAKRSSDAIDKIRNLKNKKFAASHPDQDPDAATVETLRSQRYAKGPIGKAYDDVEKKINKEIEENQSKRTQFHNDSDRRSQYLNAISQASARSAQAGGGYSAAAARRDQAEADRDKTMSEAASQGQKTAADTGTQGSQNSAQVISELNRAKSEIAQANRM